MDDNDNLSLKEIIHQLLELWIECDLDYNQFWDMTFADVKIVLEHRRNYLNRQIYNSSYLTALFVNCMFAGEKVPEYDEVFTGTKTEETQYADNTYVKELFLDYAEEWNKRRKQGGENSCQKSIEQK